MKKILVINHSNIYSNYGAATSIRDHFRVMSEDEELSFTCFYRRSLIDYFRKNKTNKSIISENVLMDKYWISIRNKLFDHIGPSFFKILLDELIPNLLSKFYNKILFNSIKKINPDIIHINSIVLLPIIYYLNEEKKYKKKIILHIRELINVEECRKFKKILINHVDSIVFIDYAVQNRFLNAICEYSPEKMFVQSNPFFAPSVINESTKKIIDSNKKIKYAIAGVIGEDKGVDFVCEAFSQASLTNAELLVIGRLNHYSEKMIAKYKNFNIKWIGELPDLFRSGAFLNIDCLIRGETSFCIGRTVYESLYSGGFVILQGVSQNLDQNVELRKFKNMIKLYEPRNLNSLINVLQSMDVYIKFRKKEGLQRHLSSNYHEYRNGFSKIYQI